MAKLMVQLAFLDFIQTKKYFLNTCIQVNRSESFLDHNEKLKKKDEKLRNNILPLKNV